MNNRKKISKYISIRPCPVTPFEGCKKYISTGDSDDFSNGEVVTFQNRPSRANLQPLVDDILFAKMKKTNKVILIDEEARELIFSTGFFAINPLLNHPRYIYFLCQSDEFNKEKDSLSFGTTQEALNERRFKQMSISFVTDHYKQNRIATYLDEKVSNLDRLIKDQQRVIEEWKAYKQSLITETVTKGLNPEVAFKDSGIEWIGEVPSHWEVKKLKHIINIKSGDSLKKENILKKGIYPVFGGGNQIGYYDKSNVKENNILIGRVGNCGLVTLLNQDCWATDNALIVESKVLLKYTYYLLVASELRNLSTSTAQPLITATKVKEHKIPFTMALCEQQQIANFLDEKCSKIDQLIEDKQRLIEELKAYKQSLIYECVTGKKEIV